MGNMTPRFNPNVTRFDAPAILASRRDLASLKPVELAYNAGGYAAGTVLGQVTATKLWKAYLAGSSDGSQFPKAILFEDAPPANFPAAGTTSQNVGIFGGEVYYDKLVGIDAGGIAALNGTTWYQNDRQILKF